MFISEHLHYCLRARWSREVIRNKTAALAIRGADPEASLWLQSDSSRTPPFPPLKSAAGRSAEQAPLRAPSSTFGVHAPVARRAEQVRREKQASRLGLDTCELRGWGGAGRGRKWAAAGSPPPGSLRFLSRRLEGCAPLCSRAGAAAAGAGGAEPAGRARTRVFGALSHAFLPQRTRQRTWQSRKWLLRIF